MSLSVCFSLSLHSVCPYSHYFPVSLSDYFRSDDQLEVQDISDSEASSSAVLPSFTRIQSRLNPVPESLNSPDIEPGENCQGGRMDGDNWRDCFALPDLIRTAAKINSLREIPPFGNNEYYWQAKANVNVVWNVVYICDYYFDNNPLLNFDESIKCSWQLMKKYSNIHGKIPSSHILLLTFSM